MPVEEVMNKIIFMTLVSATITIVPIALAQSAGNTVKASDIKKETQELISALEQYSVEQRDKALKETKQALEKLDSRIDDLESRVDDSWDKMNEESRQKIKSNLKDLHQQRNELAEWYGSLKTSSGDAWKQIKKGFSGAYQAVSQSWEKAKDEFDKTNN
jgi:predicted PurR-regulated permease PerM